MDLWGNEDTSNEKVLKAVHKSAKNNKQDPEQEKKDQFINDHINELNENSSPKAWLIHFMRLQDEVKSLKVFKSEVKDLREYVSKNERRCANCIENIQALSKEFKEQMELLQIRVNSVEDFVQTASEFIEKIEQELGEDKDE